MQAWHRRPRAVYAVPEKILKQYLPLSSSTFVRLCNARVEGQRDDRNEQEQELILGDLGLGLVLDVSRHPCYSVEAAALHQLVTDQATAVPVPISDALLNLRNTWRSGHSLFMTTASGWRGCFAEHRLWSALILFMGLDKTLKTPYSIPEVRGWFSSEVLRDMRECLGDDMITETIQTITELGFDGAPDLCMYHPNPPRLRFIEVKSETDRLRDTQTKMLQRLQTLPNVSCEICCPRSALKRFHGVLRPEDSDTE